MRENVENGLKNAVVDSLEKSIKTRMNDYVFKKTSTYKAYEIAKQALESEKARIQQELYVLRQKNFTSIPTLESNIKNNKESIAKLTQDLASHENFPQHPSLSLSSQSKKDSINQTLIRLRSEISSYEPQLKTLKEEQVSVSKQISELVSISFQLDQEIRKKNIEIQQEFEKTWTNQYIPIFTNPLEQNLETLYTYLIKYHAWLTSEANNNIQYTFLFEILTDYLIGVFDNEIRKISSLESAQIEILNKDKYHCSKIDMIDFKKTLLSKLYFYSYIFTLHIKNFVHNGWTSCSATLHHVSRFDILKFLISYQTQDNFVMDVNEFRQYVDIIPWNAQQLNIFLNIGSENAENWVLISSSPSMKTVYLQTNDVETFTNLRLFATPPKICSFNVTQEYKVFNDTSILNPHVLWHSFLFARIFPAVKNNQTIETYRQFMSPLVLLEETLKYFGDEQKAKAIVSYPYRRLTSFNNLLSQKGPAIEFYNDKKLLVEGLHTPYLFGGFNSNTRYINQTSEYNTLFNDSKIILSSKPESPLFTCLEINQPRLNTRSFYQAIELTERNQLSTVLLPSRNFIVSDPSQDVVRSSQDVMPFSREWPTLISSNVHITEVLFKDLNTECSSELLKGLVMIGARNRFLSALDADFLTLKKPEELWQRAGKEIYDFFARNTLSLDDIEQVIAINKPWAASQYLNKPFDNLTLWKFAQIRQMGTQGLRHLFDYLKDNFARLWHPVHAEPAPQLEALFDLNESHVESSAIYIKQLATQINNFKKECTPLFKRIAFILPDNDKIDQPTLEFLLQLFNVMSDRKLNSPQEPDVIELYHLDIHSNLAKILLPKISHEMNISIRIPAWDRAVNLEQVKNMELYRSLQNTLELNLRKNRAAKSLTQIHENIHSYDNNQLEASFERFEELGDINWSGEDKYYQLSTAIHGTQQQLQVVQEMQLQVVQEVQQETVKEVEIEREIQQYSGINRDFVTYENINEKGIKYWNDLPDAIRQSVGNPDNLQILFKQWTGTSRKAAGAIVNIETNAMQKLMDFASIFKSGVDWNHTPGFRVARLPENGAYVLTFSERKAKEDLLNEQVNIKNNERDPFFIQLMSPRTPQVFRGDYRQFQFITAEPGEQKQCWSSLAKEDDDVQRLENLSQNARLSSIDYQSMICHDNSPIADDMMSILRNWIIRNITNEAFATDFLDGFTEQQLLSFGQLFNYYQHETDVGPLMLLQISYRIYQDCKDWFGVWKQQFLLLRSDWTNLLDNEEVKATLRAINTLKQEKNRSYSKLFGAILGAHGCALTNVVTLRMSEIWYAFEKVAVFCEQNELVFDINCYPFEGVVEFNATLLLKRLHFSLHALLGQPDSRECQQYLLTNLKDLDCTSSGFDYAIRMQKYSWVTTDLQLSNFDHLDNEITRGSYTASFELCELDSITNPKVYALRYVAQHMQFHWDAFNRLKALILSSQCSDNIYWLRLIIASLKFGQDELTELQDLSFNGDIDTLKHINLAIDFSSKQTNIYHLRLKDLQWVAQNFPIKAKSTLNKINLLGKTLHSFEIKGLDLNLGYIQQVLDDSSGNAQFYPWAWHDINKQIIIKPHLNRLLASIHLRNTTWLPSADDIQKANDWDLLSVLEDWQRQGCCFVMSESQYRLLEVPEKEAIIAAHQAKFLPIFSEGNKILFTNLLDRLAVHKQKSIPTQIDSLCQIFSNIDTKNWFNEWGQVLGVLLQTADKKHYNVEQLTRILELFFNEEQFQTRPYPVDFIRIVLDFCKNDTQSGVLNNYSLLKDTSSNFPIDYLQVIMKSPLSYSFQKSLIQFVIHYRKIGNFDSYFILSFRLFQALQDCKQLHVQKLVEEQFIMILKNQNFNFLGCLNASIPRSTDDDYTKALKINVLNALSQNTITEGEALTLLGSNQVIHYILRLTKNCPSFGDVKFRDLVDKLSRWEITEINKLAQYYKEGPYPNWDDLVSLVENHTKFNNWVHEFETQKMPANKRHYSIHPNETKELNRVLNQIKRNKKFLLTEADKSQLLNDLYYINSFSETQKLFELPMETLMERLHESRVLDSRLNMLACLREILVRKTGKWVNHTQMLDLIVASELSGSFMTQLGTGEGKSIVTIMRVAYRALMGQMVDVFSSKESLSIRDHQEFSIFLNSLGIRNCYIDSKSDPALYHVNVDSHGVGAVHYMTMGNFSLFISGIFWNKIKNLDLYNKNRVAFLDEADHIILDESTLYNFSASELEASAYNFDEWVYQEVYQFYLQISENKFKTNEKGQIFISRNDEIKQVCDILKQKYRKNAPKESTFFRKYVIPAIHSSSDDMSRIALDLVIKRMLEAAHIAHHMEEDKAFCVKPQLRTLAEGVELPTRFAKVMIDNQEQDGSTYSDLVQQFLHVRLNREAVLKGQTPNFFVEPNTEIVISLNARFILQNFYSIIEGGTATAGKAHELEYFAQAFKMNTVIKLPTHAQRRTVKLAPVFAINREEQNNAILAMINHYRPKHPILISCEDDKAVVALGAWLEKQLNIVENEKILTGNPSPKFIIDANRNGYTEAEVLPFAGFNHSITISSRLGRGTDIKLLTPESGGLFVIETAPKGARQAKQTQGRQGRNGAPGLFIEIFNYAPIKAFEKKVANDPSWQKIFKEFGTKLIEKALEREEDAYFEGIKNDVKLQQKYLAIKTFVAYTELKQKEENQWLRYKEDVVAELSRQTMKKISESSNQDSLEKIQIYWQQNLRDIDSAWHRRMEDSSDAEPGTIFNRFIENVESIVGMGYQVLNPALNLPKVVAQHANVPSTDIAKTSDLIPFYQKYVKKLTIFSKEINDKNDFHEFLVGNSDHLQDLFLTLQSIGRSPLVNGESYSSVEIFKALADFLNSSHFFYISMKDLNIVLQNLLKINEASSVELTLNQLQILFRAASSQRTPENIDDLKLFSRLFKLLQSMYQIANIDRNDEKIVNFSIGFLKTSYTEKLLQEEGIAKIENYFLRSKKMCQYFILQTNPSDLRHYIRVINQVGNDEVLESFVQNIENKDIHPENVRDIFNLQVSYAAKSKFEWLVHPFETEKLDFLTQRPGFNSEEWKEFEALEIPKNTLTTIAPYMTPKFLLCHLDSANGKYEHGDLKRQIAVINQSAKAFLEFLSQRSIIENSTAYSTPFQPEQYEVWLQLFEGMSLKESSEFFTQAKALKNISLNALQAATTKEDFKSTLLILEKANGLPEKAIQFLENKYLAKNEHLAQYLELLLKYPFSNIDWFKFINKQNDHPENWSFFEALLSRAQELQSFIHLDSNVPLWVFKELINEYFDLLRNQNFSDRMVRLIDVWSQRLEENNSEEFNDRFILQMKVLKAISNSNRETWSERVWDLMIDHEVSNKVIFKCLELANILLTHSEVNDRAAKLLFRFYVYFNTISKEALKQVIDIDRMLRSTQFAILQEEFFNNLDGENIEIKIKKQYEFLKFLSHFPALSMDKINVLKTIYFDKNITDLKALESIIHFAKLPESIDYVLWNSFASDEKISTLVIDKYQRLFELLKEEQGLNEDDVNQLRIAFIEWKLTEQELLDYKNIILLAKSLKSEPIKFNLFFSNRSKDKERRVQLMRYVRHGLLAHLGEEFVAKCFERYAQTCPKIEIPTARCDDSFMSHMQTAFIKVFDMMLELLHINKKPFNHFDKDEGMECEVKEDVMEYGVVNKLSFEKYKDFYDSCWFTNASRKNQANQFFTCLKDDNEYAIPHEYYQNMFEIILKTQSTILEEDNKLDQTRWFSHVNSKGHSRLYDITQQVFMETLSAYVVALSKGLIPSDDHLKLQQSLVGHFKSVLAQLCEQLDEDHPLMIDLEKAGLIHVEEQIEDAGLYQDQLIEILSKAHQVPTHLKHIYESIQLFASSYEKCPEIFASGLTVG